jgi:hypothetical protein
VPPVDGDLRALDELLARTERAIAVLLASEAQSEMLHAALDHDRLERRFARFAPAYFGDLARRIHIIDLNHFADVLDDAVDENRLSRDDMARILHAGLILTGRRRHDNAEAYFVVEVSVEIDPHAVRRVIDRARSLAKLGRPAVPVVAGRSITPAAEGAAHVGEVIWVLDKHSAAPTGI